MKHGGDRTSVASKASNEALVSQADAARIANLKHGQRKSDPPNGGSDVSQADAAELMGTSIRSVQRAVVVQDKAIPEVVDMVDR